MLRLTSIASKRLRTCAIFRVHRRAPIRVMDTEAPGVVKFSASFETFWMVAILGRQ